eukprot:TRINITY_DN876_c0_g5_i1.p1 TRINITY_DN876_c0_g5~~TRINITY_DN876_c0_g5_i1.p1  ORF type:complete len:389 (-),score=67.82 TRINITY_DN876_c0_g5_i1:820-1932(-)
MRRTAPVSLLHRARKRPRSALLCHTSPAFTSAKRMCLSRTPALPTDVWHNIANHLPPSALSNLAATGLELQAVAIATLQRKLWHSFFPLMAYDALQARALSQILSLLCAAPSLRAKRISRQVSLWCEHGDHLLDHSLPPSVCFTKNNAARFLHVDACHLSKLPLAKVASRPITRHFPALYLPHVYSFFGSDRKAPLYPLVSILRATLATHSDLTTVIPHLRKVVAEDERCFHRACIADSFVRKLASENNFVIEQLGYCLDACAHVKAFRHGTWTKEFEEYAPLVSRLVKLHLALEPCYRFLLKNDGNARLKAKRLITKLMRVRSFSVTSYARTLEANLWWARSDENLARMRKEMRVCQHVVRNRALSVGA